LSTVMFNKMVNAIELFFKSFSNNKALFQVVNKIEHRKGYIFTHFARISSRLFRVQIYIYVYVFVYVKHVLYSKSVFSFKMQIRLG